MFVAMKIAKEVFVKKIQKRQLLEAVAKGYRGRGDAKRLAQLDKKTAKLTKEMYRIDGKDYSRNQVWELIIRRLCRGESPRVICDTPGYPSLRTVVAWRRNYAEFDEEYREAEQTRGIVLAEHALEEAFSAREAPDVPAAKLRTDTLKWMASKLNSKFADKQITEVQHEFKGKSKDELITQLAAALQANPKIMQMLPEAKKFIPEQIIDVEPE